MKRIILTAIFLVLMLFPLEARAGVLDFMDGIALGAGINQGTSNQADESFTLSIKLREEPWQYGFDICKSEDIGGIGVNKFGFVWGSWQTDFDRREIQDYGIYAGGGAGILLLEDDLVDWPAGPFVLLGWDFSNTAGLEGKVGYFGSNFWGTALFYWYFE